MRPFPSLAALCAGLVVLVLSEHLAAVTLLFGLEPGKSTRSDADRVFGAPVRTGAYEAEYPPQKGSGAIVVTLAGDRATIDRIELQLASPVQRDAMLTALKLTGPASMTRVIANRFVEYFGSPHSLVLTHTEQTEQSGIASVGYVSAALFARLAEGLSTAQLDPAACAELYVASSEETRAVRRSGDAPRRQAIMEVMIAAQKGDCATARTLMAGYTARYK